MQTVCLVVRLRIIKALIKHSPITLCISNVSDKFMNIKRKRKGRGQYNTTRYQQNIAFLLYTVYTQVFLPKIMILAKALYNS